MNDDNIKIDEMESGALDFDNFTAMDFNLEDTMEIPIISGEDND